MMGHWSKCSVYAVARALSEQRGFDWDQAFRVAWWAMRANEQPPASAFVVLARMESVQNVPAVPEEVARMFQLNMRNRLAGKICAGAQGAAEGMG